tara:strand:- start:31874 stop:33199 length:1326 start_codon:yes stop_codon:yes gene_type:complete
MNLIIKITVFTSLLLSFFAIYGEQSSIIPNCKEATTNPKCVHYSSTLTVSIASSNYMVYDITNNGSVIGTAGSTMSLPIDPTRQMFYNFDTVIQDAVSFAGSVAGINSALDISNTWDELASTRSFILPLNNNVSAYNSSSLKFTSINSTLTFQPSDCSTINSSATNNQQKLCNYFNQNTLLYFHTKDGVYTSNEYIPVFTDNAQTLNHSYTDTNITKLFITPGMNNNTIPLYEITNNNNQPSINSKNFGPCIDTNGNHCFMSLNPNKKIIFGLIFNIGGVTPKGYKMYLPSKVGQGSSGTNEPATMNALALCLNYYFENQAQLGSNGASILKSSNGTETFINIASKSDYQTLINNFFTQDSTYSFNNCLGALGLPYKFVNNNDNNKNCQSALQSGKWCTMNILQNATAPYTLSSYKLYSNLAEDGYCNERTNQCIYNLESQ